jgi:hypothetical protein
MVNRRWASWTSTRAFYYRAPMNKALAILLFATGCESVQVSVNCATTKDAKVECSVQQVRGKAEVEACWDFAFTCANGAAVTAPRMCQKVSGGGTETTSLPADKLVGLEKCGGTGDPKATLTNLTIDGKPANL